MKKSIFDFSQYKPYIAYRVDRRWSERGAKSSIAKAMNVQSTYVSQVLNGSADLSLEQVEALSQYWNHSTDEAHFFILLLQKDRAGTRTLKKYFQDHIDEVLKRRLVLTERLGASNTLSDEDKVRYYSSWMYSAVHIATTIPDLQTKENLSKHLGISIRKLNEILEFLLLCGLIKSEGLRFVSGPNFIRLGNDSHNIIKHHSNWRQQAIESLEREKLSEMHYSGVVSISKEDAVKVKNALLELLKSLLEIIRPSKEEELCVLTMDFFNLNKHPDAPEE